MLQFDSTYPIALHYVIGLYQPVVAGQSMNLNPLSLIPSEAEFLRYVNEYNEFKISDMSIHWKPSVTGRPRRVDTGVVAETLNASALSYQLYLNMPRQMPARYNLAVGTVSTNCLWVDQDIHTGGAITNAMLTQMEKSNGQRCLGMNSPWSYRWKAKVPESTTLYYAKQTTAAGGGTVGPDEITYSASGKFTSMKWRPLITPQNDVAANGSLPTSSLLAQLQEPVISLRENRTWTWIQGGHAMTDYGMYGQFEIHSKWHFRKKRQSTSQQFTGLANDGSFAYNQPSVLPIIDAYGDA